MLAASGAVALAQGPFIGKWKLQPAKSQITGDTIAFAPDPSGGITFTAERHSYTFKTDGQPVKDYSGADVAWKQVDTDIWQSNAKRNGITIGTSTYALSPDGKSLTVETKGAHQDGSSFDNKTVYQRVAGDSGLVGSWRSTRISTQEDMTLDFQPDGPNGLLWLIPALRISAHVKLDSQDYDVTGPTVPQGLTMALTPTGPNSFKVVQKMKGEPILQLEYKVSRDGKTMTDTSQRASPTAPDANPGAGGAAFLYHFARFVQHAISARLIAQVHTYCERFRARFHAFRTPSCGVILLHEPVSFCTSSALLLGSLSPLRWQHPSKD